MYSNSNKTDLENISPSRHRVSSVLKPKWDFSIKYVLENVIFGKSVKQISLYCIFYFSCLTFMQRPPGNIVSDL